MSNLNGRIARVEKLVEAMTWQDETELLVRQGKMSVLDVLRECGSIALETWPEWYVDCDQAEAARLAETADAELEAMFAAYSDAELRAMIDGRIPFPEDL